MFRARGGRDDGLAGGEPLPGRDYDLDDEAAARIEMRRDIAEALDLRVLCCEVHDRVPCQVGERECAWQLRGRKVADRHVDVGGTGLRSQLFDHGRRKLDAEYADASATEGQGEATRADAEFKDGSTSSQIREEVHRGLNDFRIEEVRPQRLVPLRDPSIEVVLGHAGQSDQWRPSLQASIATATAHDARFGARPLSTNQAVRARRVRSTASFVAGRR